MWILRWLFTTELQIQARITVISDSFLIIALMKVDLLGNTKNYPEYVHMSLNVNMNTRRNLGVKRNEVAPPEQLENSVVAI